jgi:hypothetical protein
MPDNRNIIDPKVERWRAWIEGSIRSDVIGLHHRRQIWREVNDIIKANAQICDVPSAFWDFHHDNYVTTQAIAIRRQADVGRRTKSLARLITEMQSDADKLTREYFVGLWEPTTHEWERRRAHTAFDQVAGRGGVHLTRKVPAADLLQLVSDSRTMKVYVDEHIAHHAATPTASLPTFADLHAAVDAIGSLFVKYATVLTASTYVTLEPAIQGDWTAIFRYPWIVPTTTQRT